MFVLVAVSKQIQISLPDFQQVYPHCQLILQLHPFPLAHHRLLPVVQQPRKYFLFETIFATSKRTPMPPLITRSINSHLKLRRA